MSRAFKTGLTVILVLAVVIIWSVSFMLTNKYLSNKVDSKPITTYSEVSLGVVKSVEINDKSLDDTDFSALDKTFKVEVTYEDGSKVEKSAYLIVDNSLASGVVKYEDLNNSCGRVLINSLDSEAVSESEVNSLDSEATTESEVNE